MNDREIMLGNVHDLRNPINGIKSHVNYLQSRLENAEDKKELEIIEQCCQDMEQLINNILEQGKMESGLFKMERRCISVRAMVDRLAASFNRRVCEKGLSLITHIEERVPDSLLGDEYVVSRMIGNLVNNALKYTTIGSIGIYIDCEPCDGRMLTRISVIDTGEGILEEWQESIFDAFGQDESVAARNASGTGLGLYIVRQMAKLMDGDVSVKSEKGEGSTFTVSVLLEATEEYKVKENQEYLGLQEFTNKLTGKLKDIKSYGSGSNKEALRQVVAKLKQSLCQGDLREADTSVGIIKILLSGGPDEGKTALRLSMAVRGARKSEALDLIRNIEDLYEKQA